MDFPAWCGASHGCHDHVMHALADVIERLERIEKHAKETIMSGLDDLNANIAAMQAEWTTFLADLQAALSGSDSDAAVEAAAQLVAQQTAAMQAADPANAPAAPPADGGDSSGDTGDGSTPVSQ